ncbi:MAG: RNA polymerase sigma factor [Actinomycetota bacterium]
MGSLQLGVETLDDHAAGEDLAASYAKLFKELSATFRARGLGADEANDLAQESLVRTFVHLKRHGRTQPDLRPLAHTIARRLYVERGRKMRPRMVELPEAEHIADPAPEPVEHIVRVEERRDVREALASLTPRHRRIVTMWMSGLRPAEIARELGIKRNAADALLHRARRQLAMKLDPSRVTLGVLGIFVLRMRAAGRRIFDSVFSIDPTGTLTQAASGLATIGVAAILIASATHGGTHATLTPHDARTDPSAVVQGIEGGGGDGIVRQGSEQRSAAPATELRDLRKYRFSGSRPITNPATGEKGRLGIDVDYIPEENPTLVDEVLEHAVLAGCQAGLFACQSR